MVLFLLFLDVTFVVVLGKEGFNAVVTWSVDKAESEVREETAWDRDGVGGVDEDGLGGADTAGERKGIKAGFAVAAGTTEVVGTKVTAVLRAGMDSEVCKVLGNDLPGKVDVVVGVEVDGANVVVRLAAEFEAEDCGGGMKEMAAVLKPGMDAAWFVFVHD